MKSLVMIAISWLSLYNPQHLVLSDKATIYNNYQQEVVFSLSCDHEPWSNFSLPSRHANSYFCNSTAEKLYIKIVTTLPDGNRIEKQYLLLYGEYYHFIIRKDTGGGKDDSYWDLETEGHS